VRAGVAPVLWGGCYAYQSVVRHLGDSGKHSFLLPHVPCRSVKDHRSPSDALNARPGVHDVTSPLGFCCQPSYISSEPPASGGPSIPAPPVRSGADASSLRLRAVMGLRGMRPRSMGYATAVAPNRGDRQLQLPTPTRMKRPVTYPTPPARAAAKPPARRRPPPPPPPGQIRGGPQPPRPPGTP
jgi:hypothetical protein